MPTKSMVGLLVWPSATESLSQALSSGGFNLSARWASGMSTNRKPAVSASAASGTRLRRRRSLNRNENISGHQRYFSGFALVGGGRWPAVGFGQAVRGPQLLRGHRLVEFRRGKVQRQGEMAFRKNHLRIGEVAAQIVGEQIHFGEKRPPLEVIDDLPQHAACALEIF